MRREFGQRKRICGRTMVEMMMMTTNPQTTTAVLTVVASVLAGFMGWGMGLWLMYEDCRWSEWE